MSRRDDRPGARRRARECALEVLYQLDAKLPTTTATDVSDALAMYFAHAAGDRDDRHDGGFEPLTPDAVTYTGQLVQGVTSHLAKIDLAVQEISQNWKVERMARVDRNVLRIATYELLQELDVPVAAVIDEAVEIARRYGTEESPAFVNGILDRVAKAQGRGGER